MEMFKKIAFSSGMPLIVIDLMIYLCGSYKNVAVSENCQRAIGLLEERTPPIYLSKGKSSMSNRCSQTSVLNSSMELVLEATSGPIVKLKRNIPPLKELPEEVMSDSSSESSRNMIEEMELEKQIVYLKVELNSLESGFYQAFIKIFKKIGQIDYRKSEKIEKMN